MKTRTKRIMALMLAAAMVTGSVATGFVPGSTTEVKAQYAPGTAPYINTWLVSGPSEKSVTDDIYSSSSDVETPDTIEKLTAVSAKGSTVLNNNPAYGADKAIDGDADTYWSTDTRQGQKWDKNMALTVDLEEVSTVTSLKVNMHERDGKKLDVSYQMIDKDGMTVKSGTVENIVPGEVIEIKPEKATGNIAKVVFIPAERRDAGNTAPNHLGFNEVEIYGAPGETVNENPDAGQISPELGDRFGDGKWEYFDDRIFNRNMDDWQDLYGYFKVKQGQETNGKYVYAHTYVYSDKDQDAQLRFVTSGLHKVYVNDALADQNATAVESTNKDNYVKDIKLKKGWNKVLLEIKHTRVSYLGFYARISDASGNEIKGLEYSTEGENAEGLEITTRGLDIDKAAFEKRNKEAGIVSNMYPENEMPNGYVQSPYIWNKAIWREGESFSGQASKFQFEAAGGAPEYKWEIIKGELPEGLSMNEEGQIEGYCKKMGEYPFTVQVTDAEGNKAVKETKIVVKERPSKWFEEGKMSALSHNTGGYSQFYDENFSFDLWAERAKEAGMTMLSTEAVQSVYYWPAPGTFPGDPTGAAAKQHPNTTEVVNGVRQPKDMVGMAKEAADRHGLRFGVYYASEGSNRIRDSRVDCSSGFFMNVEDLVKRYNPSYLFFDGHPQKRGNADAMWSAVRAYNDYALIQANDTNEVSDNDLTTYETEYYGKEPYTDGGKWEMNMHNQNKYTVVESWCHPCIKEVQGWRLRDDWRLWAEFIINQIGHGYVANYDQMIVSNRGTDWNGYQFCSNTKDVYYYYPLNAQKFLEIRENVNAWMKNAGKPDLHESLFGTMPYIFDTYEKPADAHENTEQEPFLTAKYGETPEWGYVTGRDQFVYMHMIENTITKGKDKKGFKGQDSIYVGPFDYDVTKVEWLNEGKELGFEPVEKDGKQYITIDTSSVEADPIDTIIKITTANPKRDFQLTGAKLYASQTKADELQLRTEAYLKTFTSVFADADLTYTSDDTNVAVVDENGLVKPVAEGKTTIRVKASYEGKTAEDTYKVQVKADGSISSAEELDSVVMRTEGREAYRECSTDRSLPITFEARTEKGGGIDLLSYDDVKWHYGVCSGVTQGKITDPDEYWHAREVEKTDILQVEDDKVVFNGPVEEEQNIAIWADITVDGKTYTTNKNFLRIYPNGILSDGVEVKASSGKDAEEVVDGIINSADGGNTSKWTPDADDQNPSLTMKLNSLSEVSSVSVFYNNKDRYYMNTPAGIKIEVSEDGKEWTTAVANGSVPNNGTGYAYEENKYDYAVGKTAKYVKVTFPGGAADEVMDVLEVRVNGYDVSNALNRIKVDKEISADKKEMSLDIKGFTGAGEAMDLTNAEITIASDNEKVAVVEGNTLKAAEAGISKITVAVKLDGFKVSETFYVKVDEAGAISKTTGYAMKDLPLEGMTATAGSEELNSEYNPAGNVLDNAENTIWHTKWSGSQLDERWIDIKLGESKKIKGLRVLPRQSGDNGMITKYRVEVSNDNGATYTAVTSGTWAIDASWKTAEFVETEATNVRLYAEESKGNYASAAEIRITALMPDVNKRDLSEVYELYKDTVNENYTDESWAAFQNALESAKAVLDNADALQEEIDAAAEALEAAASKLEKNMDTVESIFTITVDGEITEHKYNDAVTIEAPAEKDGKQFAYWMAGDEVVSYDTVYKFYVSKSMEFKAVYTDEAIETKPVAMLTNVFVTKRPDTKSDVKFVGELVIPEGYKVLNAGLIWSSKEGTDLIQNDELNPNLNPTYITRISDTNQFSVTIKGMPQGKSIRGSIFATVTNGTETKLIYSAEKKADAAK